MSPLIEIYLHQLSTRDCVRSPLGCCAPQKTGWCQFSWEAASIWHPDQWAQTTHSAASVCTKPIIVSIMFTLTVFITCHFGFYFNIYQKSCLLFWPVWHFCRWQLHAVGIQMLIIPEGKTSSLVSIHFLHQLGSKCEFEEFSETVSFVQKYNSIIYGRNF